MYIIIVYCFLNFLPKFLSFEANFYNSLIFTSIDINVNIYVGVLSNQTANISMDIDLLYSYKSDSGFNNYSRLCIFLG